MKEKPVIKTYSLSPKAINELEKLTQRLSEESPIKFSMSKVLELLILNASNKPLTELFFPSKG